MWDLPELPVFGMASNQMVCGWFMFAFAYMAVVGLFAIIYYMYKGTRFLPLWGKAVMILLSVAAYGLALATPAFQYTVCKRALL
jgi:hypothetical protein